MGTTYLAYYTYACEARELGEPDVYTPHERHEKNKKQNPSTAAVSQTKG